MELESKLERLDIFGRNLSCQGYSIRSCTLIFAGELMSLASKYSFLRHYTSIKVKKHKERRGKLEKRKLYIN